MLTSSRLALTRRAFLFLAHTKETNPCPNESERREAERRTLKSAYQALRQQRAESAVLSPISEAQLTANRANSQRSTGPMTDEGKAISSQNALKHGLTSKTTVLPTEDPALYQRELDSFLDTYQPATREETLQLETLADSLWRLARLRRIETGILAKGCLELKDKPNSNPEVEAYLKYEKSIRNLHIQEARLQRQIQKAQAELARLQTIRRREAAAAAKTAKQTQTTAKAAPNGFDFSAPETTAKPTTRTAENPPPSHG